MSNRPFCDELPMIDILKLVGEEARTRGRLGWVLPTQLQWSDETLAMAKDLISEVRQNIWRTLQPPPAGNVVYAASDASGNHGYGGVVWDESGVIRVILQGIWSEYRKEFATAHIFLKEYLAAVLTIELLCKCHRGCTITLAIDNTAVVHSLRARYSSNRYSCEFIKRTVHALKYSDNVVVVVAVISADNPADGPSRGYPIDIEAS